METVSIKVSIYLNLIILPLIKLYSPDTKLKNRTKISVKRKFRKFQEFDVISKNWRNSRKNFSNDLLSTYVLLIQSRIFGQKFQSIENFENSRNLTSLPRISEIPRIWRHFQELAKNFSNDLLPTYVLLIQNPNFG